MSGASTACFDRPAQQATEPRAKREVMSALCHSLVVDLTFERSASENVAIIHGEFEQLLLACSEGCGLQCCFHLRMHTVLTGTRLYIRSMLLVVFSHNNYYYPMIVTSNILVIIIILLYSWEWGHTGLQVG